MVTEWPAGVSAASRGRQAVGRLHFLPSSGSAYSRPQYDASNRGLTRTISAISACLSSVASDLNLRSRAIGSTSDRGVPAPRLASPLPAALQQVGACRVLGLGRGG